MILQHNRIIVGDAGFELGLLPRKSGVLPMSHHISEILLYSNMAAKSGSASCYKVNIYLLSDYACCCNVPRKQILTPFQTIIVPNHILCIIVFKTMIGSRWFIMAINCQSKSLRYKGGMGWNTFFDTN